MNLPTRKICLSWLINIVLLIAVYFGMQAYQGRHAPTGPAPTIHAMDIHGKTIDPRNYREKPTLIYFWATWCGVCSMTRSSIHSIAQDHPVITIASQSGADQALHDYQQEHNFDVTIINDQSGELSQRYGVQAFPSIFILDANGNISDVEIGLSSEWGLRFRLWWAVF